MDQDNVRDQIKADLTFAHQMMMATSHMARLREQNIEAEVTILHALTHRMVAAMRHRGMPTEAATRYDRVFIAPQRRRTEAARVTAASARREANKWARAHDGCIDRASQYRGHAS